jgi:hypothetical protein
MSQQWLRDALLELLELHMAEHIERGLDYHEALMLGVEEIKRQIRGSRGDLVTMLTDDVVLQARYAREARSRSLH